MVRNGCRKLTGVLIASAWLAVRPALAATPAAPVVVPAPAPTGSATPNALGLQWMEKAKAGKPLWATLETSQGRIVVQLASAAAPQSVSNFVGLATGGLLWMQGKTPNSAPLYDGTSFHRTIPGFVIQGGDPTGTGTGGPGFTTPDESQSPAQHALHFTRGAVGLSHAPDPSANGSQFFIVLGDSPWLDGRYTQIGTVVAGVEVADAIAAAPRGPQDRPLQAAKLLSVKLADHAPTPSKPAHPSGKKSR